MNAPQLIIGGHAHLIRPGKSFSVDENKLFELTGLDPSSRVSIKLALAETYEHWAVTDSNGHLAEAQAKGNLGTHELGGDSFEVSCWSGGRAIEFILDVTRKHFAKQAIEQMLEDLERMRFRWDRNSSIPTRTGDLKQHVEMFVSRCKDLNAVFEAIIANPDTVLLSEMRLVPVRAIKSIDPHSVRLNIRSKRLNADGSPASRKLLVPVDVPSVDTGGNAYVVETFRLLTQLRFALGIQVQAEARRLEIIKEREAEYFRDSEDLPTSKQIKKHLATLRALKQDLDRVTLTAPESTWKQLRTTSDGSANVVRFDPRYKKVKEARALLGHNNADPATSDRLQRIADFGRRSHSEIYEVWVVAKSVEALHHLGFRSHNPIKDPDEWQEAFLQLENPAGADYGLRDNAPVALCHKDVSSLFIKVVYEAAVPDRHKKDRPKTPDISVVLRGSASETNPPTYNGRKYGDQPLFLDAKFQARSIGGETLNYMTKYANLRNGAFAHLLHIGELDAWAQRTSPEDREPEIKLYLKNLGREVNYFPYRLGISPLHPNQDRQEVERGLGRLRKVVYAWLVSLGVVGLCPKCGSVLERTNQSDVSPDTHPLHPFRGQKVGGAWPKKRSLQCHQCGLGLTANYCSSCRSNNLFTPIIKLYPHVKDASSEMLQAWINDYEISAQSTTNYRMRHCPRCGY